ncbi:relaxase domain-containing protein [Corynebacterium sp. SCR221107]|uniref:MobF family relaxase n=1 Tax=Corynebacterium sp. SCR221107 TaxID=3017361 RepID=UPI0022EC200D|nr:MobF family relaxase [Corynebacterium sp. SCR221107]WBT09410.1 relaxase domain-containing protein [Corynebacterium sp. SCR221107]
MMSFRAVHAGSGYQYLLRSVATNDAYDESTEAGKLANYYQAKGTPPGRWIGAGLEGLNSSVIEVGAHIEAEQMEALYGLGYHPDTHALLESGKTLEECKLGGKFPVYTNQIPVLDALRDAERGVVKSTGRLLTEDERMELAISIGREYYVEATGYINAPDRDVIDWVNKQRAEVTQAVAGFDFTFSPTKSVSVLWALSDEKTASKIAACHHEAVAEVLAWAEENVVRTRLGAGGLAQVKTRGLIAAEFTHFDTRAGDPDLHSHVLVANKVQGPDGKWRTLDSRALFKNNQTLSARYDAVLQETLTRKMGLSFVPIAREAGKEPVWEVAGVPQKLIDEFSKRRAMARPVFDKLRSDYVEKHGHQPDKRAQDALWQAAILDTRDAKKPAESLETLRENWVKDVLRLDDGNDLLAAVYRVSRGKEPDQRPRFFTDGSIDEKALDERCLAVIDRMVQKRSYFARHHVTAAVGTLLKGFVFADSAEAARAFELLTERIIDKHLVDLTEFEPQQLPQALHQEDGVAVDRHIGFSKYTTEKILAQEDYVLHAVEEPVAVFADSPAVFDAVSRFEDAHGFELNEGQVALARHLLQSGTLVACGVGPAGTGKTTSMQIVADVWTQQGHNVIGLAPSAAAASVLSEELSIPAHTIDTLTYSWRGRGDAVTAGDVSALPLEINPGDMLLVDEAGMATTDNLAALVEIAEATGAIVRVIGDPQQLDAVGTGGLFDTMCRYNDAVELTDVMRFSHGKDPEQAEASIGLRSGEASAVDFYEARGWLHGGTREQMLVEAVNAYLADTARGRRSLVVASTNADVDAMNEMIREYRIEQGEVDSTAQAGLSRGDVCGVGDLIIARKNQRFPNEFDPSMPGHRVINGQLFHVAQINEDGSLLVADAASGEMLTLPADYVAKETHLGYAATVYRAQGATVDTTHAVIDSSTDRASLYVALTRGKKENRVYAVTDGHLDEMAELSHEHSSGNKAGLTARDVFEHAVKRDTRQRSATDIRAEAEEYADSFERVAALFRFGRDQAIGAFIDRNLDSWWDRLDADAAATLTTDGMNKVRTAWMECIDHGLDPRDLMASACFNLGEVDEAGAVIAWRIRDQLDQAGVNKNKIVIPGNGNDSEATIPAGLPPVTRGSDLELAQWLKDTRERLMTWSQPVVENEEAVPALEQTIEGLDTSLLDIAGVSRDIREDLAAAANEPRPREELPENDWFSQFEQNTFGNEL